MLEEVCRCLFQNMRLLSSFHVHQIIVRDVVSQNLDMLDDTQQIL